MLYRKGADDHLMPLNIISDVNTMFSIVVSHELWFIGDKFLQEAFAVMMNNKNHFHPLQEFDQMRSKFSAMMLMEYMLLALVHLLNTHRCIPDMIVVHIRESDFLRETNKQQRCNVAVMTVKVRNSLSQWTPILKAARWYFTQTWFLCPGMWDGINNKRPIGPGQDLMGP